MTFVSLVFYLLAFVTLTSAVVVVSARNPVHSVLFLILAFFSAAGLFVLLGAEYIAMTLVIVYVGAVAVLFLFVVMMLDINFAELRQGFLRYLPTGLAVAMLFLIEILAIVAVSVIEPSQVTGATTPITADVSNAEAIGNVLYTKYLYLFQASGLILLVAMIGAIVLTLRHREGTRRQNISRQVKRRKRDSVTVVSVQTGKGI